MSFDRLRRQDWSITAITATLALVSIILIFSTTYNAKNLAEGSGTVAKQIVFFLISFGIYFLISVVDISWLKQKGTVIFVYLGILGALLYVLLFGTVIENTQRWILLGPFSFQPAEFAKIVIIIVGSYIYTLGIGELGPKLKFAKKLLLSFLSVSIYGILIYLQPSLGNALILFLIWAIVLFVAAPINTGTVLAGALGLVSVLAYYKVSFFDGIAQGSFLEDNWKLFVVILLICSLIVLRYLYKLPRAILILVLVLTTLLAPAGEFAWNNLLKDYQRNRIVSYIAPSSINNFELTSGYQVKQSRIAIGSGQLTGTGFLMGKQSTLQNLPFAHTDFIFAALAEQFGFIGVILLLCLYGGLYWRVYIIFANTSDTYSKILLVGVIAVLSTNIFINISMNMGLIPVTGVPLPLVSYGGSSVLLGMICLGLVQMIKISTKQVDYAEKLSWDRPKSLYLR